MFSLGARVRSLAPNSHSWQHLNRNKPRNLKMNRTVDNIEAIKKQEALENEQNRQALKEQEMLNALHQYVEHQNTKICPLSEVLKILDLNVKIDTNAIPRNKFDTTIAQIELQLLDKLP
eukprot:UN18758